MKNLIIYFTYSNNTKNLIENVNKEFGFDTIRVERKVPYSDDYDTCAYKEAKEEIDKHLHPEIKKLPVDVNKYDNILLFFPIWWYTIPMPIATLFDGMKNYKGKVYVFANSYTNDPQYMRNSMKDLKKLAPNVQFVEGLFNQSAGKHVDFIKKI